MNQKNTKKIYLIKKQNFQIIIKNQMFMNLIHQKNKIKLSGINDDYIYTIKRIFNYYKIPINLNNKISIYSNSIVKDYLEGKELKENETTIPIIKKIRNIEKDLLDIDPNSKEYKDIFIDILKHTYYDNKKYDNAINIINIYDEEINDDEYLFLLGFNLDVYPTIDKDIDFLSDIEKVIKIKEEK